MMKNRFKDKFRKNFYSVKSGKEGQEGSAIVIAVLVMMLLLAFVALALSRTTSETISASNDTSESKTFSAAQASLEVMTRNFSKIFDVKLAPEKSDLDDKVVALKPPGFEAEYTFDQKITQTAEPKTVLMGGTTYKGLNASRDEWELQTTVTEKATGVQVELHRQFFNNLIPIFQFGIFYDDDLEIHPGARFDFGGRVHSNSNLFTMTSAGTYFNSRVSAVGQIITEIARNGKASAGKWGEKTYIKNASLKDTQLGYTNGSVTINSALAEGSSFFDNPDMPVMYRNKNWKTGQEAYGGNLLAEQPRLDLPLKIASQIEGKPLDYVEIIKRGKNKGDLYQKEGATTTTEVTDADKDTIITQKGRYYDKKGIRISLADSRIKLPGCATATSNCGKRLDGAEDGEGGNGNGYQPVDMKKGSAIYRATRVNGDRLRVGSRQVWIKVELVDFSEVDNSINTKDVTADFLSLGVTEAAPEGLIKDTPKLPTKKTDPSEILPSASNYDDTEQDSRSVIKLQRFLIGGSVTSTAESSNKWSTEISGNTYVISDKRAPSSWVCKPLYTVLCAIPANVNKTEYFDLVTPTPTAVDDGIGTGVDKDENKKYAYLDSSTELKRIVPFPIQMFDAREGLYNVTKASTYGTSIPMNGVMSMVDIDVKNLKRFFDGEFNDWMPTNTYYATDINKKPLKPEDVPQLKGWVVYISDRRGDYDFDGEYDMENVYTSNTDEAVNSAAAFQKGEDVNLNKKLDVLYDDEAPRYTPDCSSGKTDCKYAWLPEKAATVEHKYYRRGVRLINAETLPGTYNELDSSKTRGFTVASENGIYVKGNFNANSIDSVGTPTQSSEYGPKDSADIPASIAADAVTILSNNWKDANSFKSPFNTANRVATETFLRFAMLSGDTMSSKETAPNQGGDEANLSGGVHNFKRFLEKWGGVRVNYSGSLINLFYSHNNNGTYKPSGGIYDAPTRNWVFNTSFQDPNRLPPGTPYFQSIQLTGFERVSD